MDAHAPLTFNQVGDCPPQADQHPFEQLPNDLIFNIFAMLSLYTEHTMHLVSTRFSLLRNNVQYYTDHLTKRHNKYQSRELFNHLIKERSAFVNHLNLKGKIFYRKDEKGMFEGIDLDQEQEKDMRSKILSCTNLKSLKYTYRFEEGFLKELVKLEHLTSLVIDPDVCESELKCIGPLTHLKVLHINICILEWYRIEQLTNLIALETLTLRISEIQPKFIAVLTNLKVLNLRYEIISQGDLQDLRKLTQLKTLKLSPFNNCIATFDFLSVLKLESLYLGFTCSKIDVKGLESQTALTTLRIKAILDKDAIKRISTLTNLRKLNLSKSNIDQDVLKNLSKLQKLEHLNVFFLKLNKGDKDEGRKKLPQNFIELFNTLQKITYLNLSHAYCTDGVLASFTQMTNLRHLNVYYSLITKRGIHSITHLTKLTQLNLNCNAIGNSGAMQLTTLTNLKKLQLHATGINNKAIIAIATLRMRFLKDLDISSNTIDAEILDNIGLLPSLRRIDLSRNNRIQSNQVLEKLTVYEEKDLMFKRREV